MAFDLGRSLLLSDAISADALAEALLVAATNGVSLIHALLATDAIELARLEEELARADAPVLRHVVPVASLVRQLPPGLCERLLAAPVRRDARTGAVDVAVVDARDAHGADEIAYWLGTAVRVLRTSYGAMDAALKRMNAAPERGVRAPAAPAINVPVASELRAVAETPMYGTPAAPHEEAAARLPSVNIPINLTRRSGLAEENAPRLELSPRRRTAAREPPTLDDPLPEPGPVIELRRREPPLKPLKPPRAARDREADEDAPPSRAPVTARGPFAPEGTAPPATVADVGAMTSSLRAAGERDVVLELLLEGVRTVARKVAIFIVKKDAFVGAVCTPELGDAELVRRTRVPLAAPTILAQAVHSTGTHLGRVTANDAHAPLLKLWSSAPGDVAVVAVRIDGRPALVIVADEIGDTLLAAKRMEELAGVAGESLARILRAKRRR